MAIDDFVAKATISIIADRNDVWDALVNRAAIELYQFGASVDSEWRTGSEITWKGELNGIKYEDKGVILKVEPEKMLQYSRYKSLSGTADISDNYHFVSIYLADGAATTEVSVNEDNNEDENARIECEKNWLSILNGLKAYLEIG